MCIIHLCLTANDKKEEAEAVKQPEKINTPERTAIVTSFDLMGFFYSRMQFVAQYWVKLAPHLLETFRVVL